MATALQQLMQQHLLLKMEYNTEKQAYQQQTEIIL